jgi:putative heme transporter
VSPAELPVPARSSVDRRRLLLIGLAAATVIAVLYVVVPAVAGLDETWTRLSSGEPGWLLAGLCLEVLSFLSYMALFRLVIGNRAQRIDWIASYRITMAGVVATRLLALAGAGGIALTVWALRRVGMRRREVAARMAAFYILLYGVYMAALVVGGLGLYAGLFSGPAPPGLTLVPAALGAFVIAVVLLVATLSDDLDAVLGRVARKSPDASRAAKVIAAIPATISSGVRNGLALLRAPRPGLLGAIGWFAFDIGVLWACLAAFGTPPSGAVVVMAYFVGMTANTLPLPGGIGAVDGGMIGALIGFGVDGGLAIVGVLSYRAFAFWLPIGPGLVAYLHLLRTPASSGVR